MYKFSTMRHGADDAVHRAYVRQLLDEPEAGPHGGTPGVFKLDDDVRITNVGSVLRRTSLDELPQLWNVVRGPWRSSARDRR